MASNTTLCANSLNTLTLNTNLQSPVNIVAKTATGSITSNEIKANSIITNRGASGGIILDLPAPSQDLSGHVVHVLTQASQTITLRANTDDTLQTVGNANQDTIVQAAGAAGSCIKLICDGSQFFAIGVGNTPGGTAALRYNVATA